MQLLSQQMAQDKLGVYGYVQRELGWHSSRLEGTGLSPRQADFMFDLGMIVPDDADPHPLVDDVLAMHGQFALVARAVRDLGKALDMEILLGMRDAFSPRDAGNGVLPHAESAMGALLSWYGGLKEPSLEDLAEFHAAFLQAAPFRDGNGQIARALLFRECVRAGVPPMIVRADDEEGYRAALAERASGGTIDALAMLLRRASVAFMQEAIPMLFGFDEADGIMAAIGIDRSPAYGWPLSVRGRKAFDGKRGAPIPVAAILVDAKEGKIRNYGDRDEMERVLDGLLRAAGLWSDDPVARLRNPRWGVLSIWPVIDGIAGYPMDDEYAPGDVTATINMALAGHKGAMGNVLRCACDEAPDAPTIARLLADPGKRLRLGMETDRKEDD